MTDQIRYEYKMIQLPRTFVLKKDQGNEIAAYLEKLSNEWVAKGWEFYRIDSVAVAVPPGCFAALGGAQVTMTNYNIVTFRRIIQPS